MKNENDNIGKKLDLADSWLTKFGTIKKHWGKLLFILFCYCAYWVLTQPAVKEDPQTQSYPEEAGIYYDSTDVDSLTTE